MKYPPFSMLLFPRMLHYKIIKKDFFVKTDLKIRMVTHKTSSNYIKPINCKN
jgi:hypothetical protein